jgi:hypothetical protein
MNNEPKKFNFVPVNPKTCTPEEAEVHLRSFGKSFIDMNRFERWIHIMLEKPAKATEMDGFIDYLNPQFCKIMKGADSFPCSLIERYGSKLGVYFDGKEPPTLMTSAEAASLSIARSTCAVFSIIPGKLGIFFGHDGIGAWICERH